MSVEDMLNTTCTIRRKTDTRTSATYGPNLAWTNAATLVPCAVFAGSGGTSGVNKRETESDPVRIYFAGGTDITKVDRIVSVPEFPNVHFSPIAIQQGGGREASEYVKATCIHQVGDGIR